MNCGSLSADECTRTVCFVARGDFESRPGGDTVQWRMYERVVREAGLRATTSFDNSSIPPADVYHAFNVDRPLELYPKLAEVKRRGRPFILSTIHHPHEWMTKYYMSQPSDSAHGSLLRRSALGRSVPARETVREIVSVARDRRIALLLALVPSWRQRVRWLLRNADRIMLLTDSEAAYIQTDFGYEIPRPQQVIVPNWSEGLGDASAEKPDAIAGLPEPPVLVVGRIEARKASLRVARLAERARRHVIFVGRPLRDDGAFARAFHLAMQRNLVLDVGCRRPQVDAGGILSPQQFSDERELRRGEPVGRCRSPRTGLPGLDDDVCHAPPTPAARYSALRPI